MMNPGRKEKPYVDRGAQLNRLMVWACGLLSLGLLSSIPLMFMYYATHQLDATELSGILTELKTKSNTETFACILDQLKAKQSRQNEVFTHIVVLRARDNCISEYATRGFKAKIKQQADTLNKF